MLKKLATRAAIALLVALTVALAPVAAAETIADYFALAKNTHSLNQFIIIAKDGTKLGTLDLMKGADSIFNEFGKHGSKFAVHSIWNEFGLYGGEFSIHSPFNEFTTSPPMLYYRGNAVCFLSANTFKPSSITIGQMLSLVHSP